MNNFISEIKINKLRHLHDLTIQLGDTKKNLILTGKNGSGKTSLLQNLNKFVVDLLSQSSNIKNFYTYKDRLNTLNIIEHKSLFDSVNRYANCYPVFNDNDFYNAVKADKFDFIYAFFQAKRQSQTEAKSIDKITLSSNKSQRLNQDFLRYIVNLKAKKSFANDDGDVQTTKAIDDWFINFENMLKKLYSDESLTLKFDRDNFNFTIHRDNREPSDFNTQSDGFSAILDIVTELILKVESTQRKKFDCEGIVLIDESEKHFAFINLFFPQYAIYCYYA
jgi:energy-coupling factor transporter ATP-binding protein EcfA2